MGLFKKKNLIASKPSEYSPNQGGKLSKRLGGNIGCKAKNSSWHLIGFPDGSSICFFVSHLRLMALNVLNYQSHPLQRCNPACGH